MKDFIQNAASRFGLGEDKTTALTGGILGLMKDQADGGDFSKLMDKVPGADSVLKAGKSGGGVLGSAANALGGMLGGGGTKLAGLASVVQQSGLSMDKAGGFASMLVGYLKEKAGGELVGRLLNKVPELSKLVG